MIENARPGDTFAEWNETVRYEKMGRRLVVQVPQGAADHIRHQTEKRVREKALADAIFAVQRAARVAMETGESGPCLGHIPCIIEAMARTAKDFIAAALRGEGEK